jgi:MFS transporter, putative metabolite transport protein
MIDPSDSEARVEYDEAPLRLFHLRVAIASSGGVFSDGYGLGIIGISLSRAATHLALSPVWMGLLGGASLFGLFAGALLTGPAADRLGRRPIFAYNMAILAALSLSRMIAWRTALLQASLARRLGENDAWIAGTALAYQATLAGRERAFARVPSLDYLTF